MIKRLALTLLATVALTTSACAAEEQTTTERVLSQATATLHTGFNAPDEAWREIDPENTLYICLLYTSPSPRDRTRSRMPSSA